MPKKKPKIKAVDYLTYLNSEAGKDDLEKVCKAISSKMQTDDANCERYFESVQFQALIIKLKTHMEKTHEILSPDEYKSKTIIKGVRNEKFYYLFKTIFNVLEADIYSTDFEWSNENIEYKGIIFTRIHGQGTHCEMALIKDSRFRRK